MGVQFQDNIKYLGKLPNFTRDVVSTVEELAAVDVNSYATGCIVYCVEAGQHFTFDDNINDATYGHFKLLGGIGGITPNDAISSIYRFKGDNVLSSLNQSASVWFPNAEVNKSIAVLVEPSLDIEFTNPYTGGANDRFETPYSKLYTNNIKIDKISSGDLLLLCKDADIQDKFVVKLIPGETGLSNLIDWYNTVVNTDSEINGAIDKWHEIVNFLEGISDDATQETLQEIIDAGATKLKKSIDIDGYQFDGSQSLNHTIEITSILGGSNDEHAERLLECSNIPTGLPFGKTMFIHNGLFSDIEFTSAEDSHKFYFNIALGNVGIEGINGQTIECRFRLPKNYEKSYVTLKADETSIIAFDTQLNGTLTEKYATFTLYPSSVGNGAASKLNVAPKLNDGNTILIGVHSDGTSLSTTGEQNITTASLSTGTGTPVYTDGSDILHAKGFKGSVSKTVGGSVVKEDKSLPMYTITNELVNDIPLD